MVNYTHMFGYWVQGYTINTFDLLEKQYPLIYAGDAPNITGGFTGSISRYQKGPKIYDSNFQYNSGMSFRVLFTNISHNV